MSAKCIENLPMKTELVPRRVLLLQLGGVKRVEEGRGSSCCLHPALMLIACDGGAEVAVA